MKRSFYETIKSIDWNDITKRIYAKTESDVMRALSKKSLDIEDFMALVSPLAEKYLEQMAQMSRDITQKRLLPRANIFSLYAIMTSAKNSCFLPQI